MTERRVYCGGLHPPRGANALQLNVDPRKHGPHRVNLRIDDLTRPLSDNIPGELADMLEIATYIYCADQFTGRGTPRMSRMGAEWRRRFYFNIPVRRLDIWSNPELTDSLTRTVGFLSEDEFVFEFVQARDPAPVQAYLGFSDPNAQVIAPEQVILFSGGLDSLSGAVDTIIGHSTPAVLVSHQASNTIASKQKELAAALKSRAKPRTLLHVPVKVNKGKEEASDFTQRSRSLLFASIGLVVAKLFNLRSVDFYENGIVSLNLPIAEHVIGARASRTTHPRFLADCGSLFGLLTGDQFDLRNPFIWKTKSDVLRLLAQQQCSDLIPKALSCTRVRELTKYGRQCGVCSQCIDRRFAVHAACMAILDPPEHYRIDVFRDVLKPGPDLTMIESYVNRAQRLATMSQQAFVATYGQIFRAIPYLPGSADDNVNLIWDLHRRHGEDIVSVVDEHLAQSNLNDILQLAPDSLLSMIMSRVAEQPPYVDPIESQPTVRVQASADTIDYAVSPIHLATDAASRRVLFDHGIELSGVLYELVAALMEDLQADIAAGIPRDEYRFVQARTLAARLNIEEASLRKRIGRCREQIAAAYLDRCGRQLGLDDVIENIGWQGYRLNPYLLLVHPAQLRAARGPMSHSSQSAVTNSGTPR
jgi:7-cyano-7-deazaguanine synthase in queuosine biosynthesis